MLHWDPAKSEYFYYYYDVSDIPAPTEEDSYQEVQEKHYVLFFFEKLNTVH